MAERKIDCLVVNGLIKALEDTLTALNIAQGELRIPKTQRP